MNNNSNSSPTENYESQIDDLRNTTNRIENQNEEILRMFKLMHAQLVSSCNLQNISISNEFDSSNHNVFCEFIQNSEIVYNDLSKQEVEVAQLYNEFLKYPILVNQISITAHHRILSKALEFDRSYFDYTRFIKFIIESITKSQKYENLSLLIYFDETDFSTCLQELNELKQNSHYESHYLEYRNDRYIELFNNQINQEIKFDKLRQENEEHRKFLENKIEELNHQIQQQQQFNDHIEALKRHNEKQCQLLEQTIETIIFKQQVQFDEQNQKIQELKQRDDEFNNKYHNMLHCFNSNRKAIMRENYI